MCTLITAGQKASATDINHHLLQQQFGDAWQHPKTLQDNITKH